MARLRKSDAGWVFGVTTHPGEALLQKKIACSVPGLACYFGNSPPFWLNLQ